MIKVKVRCWRIQQSRPVAGEADKLFITYPEDNVGHSLITCITCGALFAVTVELEVYIGPPLNLKLEDIACQKCGNKLGDNWAYYPENYVLDGQVYSFERPTRIPPDDESLVLEFDGIYEA